MHHYKGQLRRQPQDYTPTKSSWDKDREYAPPSKNDSRCQNKYQSKQQQKYDIRYEGKYDTRYDKSEISYYQSQASRMVYDYDRSERPSTRSQVVLNDQRFVFDQLMPVRIKSYQREQYQAVLRLQVQAKNQKAQSMLSIYITDDSNPKFLWTFNIKEADFMNLKGEQKLKVSYAGFPEMLENCLRECQGKDEGNGERANHLLLQIRKGGEGTLFVLQSNRYKESVHLFLHFKLANDEQIKDHLSNKLIEVKEQHEQKRVIIAKLENALSDRRHEIEIKDIQLKQLRSEKEKVVEQMRMEEQRKINDLESKYIAELTKIKKEHQHQVKQLKHREEGLADSLKVSSNDMGNKLADARERIAHFQSNERENKIKIARLEQDMNKYLKEADQLKVQNRELSEKRFQNEKNITELSCKIDSLKSELEDKKTIIVSTVQLKQTNNSQISALQLQTSEQKKQLIKLQTKITELEGEVSRLNSSNGQLSQKIQRQKEKLQQRAEIIKEQQKEIKELKRAETTLNRQNQDLKIRNSDKEARVKTVQEQLELCQKKLQDEAAMVVYLQKNLNQRPALRTPSYLNNSYQSSLPYSALNREIPSQLSNNSNVMTANRVALSTNHVNREREERTEKYEPNIKRYEDRDRSKSPLPKRLAQQKEPQEDEGNSERQAAFEQPRPVKFKMSQPAKQSYK